MTQPLAAIVGERVTIAAQLDDAASRSVSPAPRDCCRRAVSGPRHRLWWWVTGRAGRWGLLVPVGGWSVMESCHHADEGCRDRRPSTHTRGRRNALSERISQGTNAIRHTRLSRLPSPIDVAAPNPTPFERRDERWSRGRWLQHARQPLPVETVGIRTAGPCRRMRGSAAHRATAAGSAVNSSIAAHGSGHEVRANLLTNAHSIPYCDVHKMN
jgi:hypothetical protein